MDTLSDFLGEVSEQGLLEKYPDLVMILETQVDPAKIISGGKQTVLKKALTEMTSSDLGVHTVAAIMIGYINAESY